MGSFDANLFWSACVPVSGFLAAFALLFLTASSYGSRRDLEVRILLWSAAFAISAEAVRLTARLLTVEPPPVTTHLESTLSFGAALLGNMVVIGAVCYTAIKHESTMKRKKGVSAAAADLSWKPLPASLTGELSSFGRETSHA